MHSTTNAGDGDSAAKYCEEQTAYGRECLAAALAYLQRGWCPLPLCHPLHHGAGRNHVSRCKSPGKAPLVNWLEFQQRRPTEKELAEWWRYWPWSSVGLLLGRASGNLAGIDLDGAGAEAKFLELCGGSPQPTLSFLTPRLGGGRRVLYQLPADVEQKNVTVAFPDGELKILAEGGVTVMPPSRHHTGGVYTWED
jgi:hypothetical protein